MLEAQGGERGNWGWREEALLLYVGRAGHRNQSPSHQVSLLYLFVQRQPHSPGCAQTKLLLDIPGDTGGSHACNVLGVLHPPHTDPTVVPLPMKRAAQGTKCLEYFLPLNL